ncbi:MAG TPA: hypothetical protein VHO00_07785 [Actinomycetes bacterium]|nr:hypothetical protein [Actinomycetes bacterium]
MRTSRRSAVRIGAALAIAFALAVPAASAQSSTPPGTFVTMTGDQPGEGYGWAASELADIDGDGAAEVITGNPFHTDADGTFSGHTDVRSARTGDVIYTFIGQPGELHGYAIAAAGDVNGDRAADLIVGAPGAALSCGSNPQAGRAYVYSGADGSTLLTLDGEAAGDQYGAAVGSAGDVNRDGRADLLVGAPCFDGVGADSGKAYVVSGRTGRVLRSHAGQAAGDHFGIGIAPAGLVDRDHFIDHIIGASDAGTGGRGLAYVFSGWTGRQLLALDGGPDTMDLGWFFVAGLGDVNGDKRDDLYVGDFNGGPDGDARGLAFVFSGKTGAVLHQFEGDAPGDGAGPGRYAGDVDGDGRNDVAVGSYLSSAGAPQAGLVKVYSGNTGALLRTYVSTVAGENLGFDAVGLGDVDGDGHVDLALTAASGDRVYIVSSTAGG